MAINGRNGMGRRMPDTGGRELNDFTSWNTVSKAFRNMAEMKRRAENIKQSAFEIYQRDAAITSRKNYARFNEGLNRASGSLNGKVGRDVDDLIKVFQRTVASKGGDRIEKGELSKAIDSLQKGIGRVSGSASGLEKELLNSLSKDLSAAVQSAAKGGFGAMGKDSSNAIRQGFGFQTNNTIEESRKALEDSINNTAATIFDPTLKKALEDLRDEMNKNADAARDSAEKQKAVADAAGKINGLKAGARGADAAAVDALSKSAEKNSADLKKTIVGQNQGRRTAELNSKLGNLTQAIGTSFKYLVPIKRSLDIGTQIFQAINQKANQFARMQMRISSERGAYGRLMRGAGMDFSSMMSAIGTGRRAGMDDRDVVNKMATIQEQLARARWGEGPIIENMGKWGLTPFDENGNMKDFRQVMVDISNKFNTLGSEAEKLQFLSMQGFRPDQMEFVKNYARDARRWEEIKRNPRLQGVLESSRILDDTGFYAKADAATRIELKRRQILNENAIDDGVMQGLMRSLHPENWFFNDWTARQKGVQAAQSEMAMKKLQDELERVRLTMKDNNAGLKKVAGGLVSLDAATLQGLSLTGGWAQADIDNKGAKSSVHDLRELYAKMLGLENLDKVEDQKKGLAMGVGAAGAVLTLAALLAIPTGGLSLATGLGLAVSAGAAGGLGAYAISNSEWDDGSEEHVKNLRKLRGNTTAIERYLEKNHLEGLTPEMIESPDFNDDKKARETLQSGFVTGRLLRAQALTTNQIDVVSAKNYAADKFYIANKKAAQARGETLDEQRHIEAMARAGSGDQSIGLDAETAYNYIRYGFDKNSIETRNAVSQRIGKLRQKYQKQGETKTYEELKSEAQQEVENEFKKNISPEIYRAARGMGELSEEQQGQLAERYAKEWDTLTEEGGNMGVGTYFTNKYREDKDLDKIREKLEKAKKYRAEHEGDSMYDQKMLTKSVEFYEKLLDQAQYGSKEEYVKAKMAGAQSTEELDKMIWGEGKKPMSYMTDAEKRQAIEQELASGEGGGLSLGGKLARIARKNNVKVDVLRNALMTDEEAADIAGRIERGEEVSAEQMEIFEQYKKGSKYQKQQKAREKEKKQNEEKKKAEEDAKYVDNLIAERFGPNGEGGYQVPIEGESGEVGVRDIQAMRKAKALGYDLTKGFSASQISKFEEDEAKRKAAFTGRGGIGDEDEYEEFRDLENRILRGEEVSEEDRKSYEATKGRLDKALTRARRAEYKPLNEEYVPTAEEKAADEATFRNAKIADAEGRALAARGDLNKFSDMRSIAEAKKKGWSEKRIKQHFGQERYDEYLASQGIKPPEVDKRSIAESGFPTDTELSAVALMQQKSKGVEQVVDKMSANGTAAEAAAESAKKAEGANVNNDNSMTIYLGGQQITQNIQGAYPLDQEGMKQGTLEGATEIREVLIEGINSVARSVGGY